MIDYYKTLEVTPSASLDEIKRSYRDLAFKFHPDRNQGNRFSAARFTEIAEAYEVLSNSTTRKEYDEYLNISRAYTPPPPSPASTYQQVKTEPQPQKKAEPKEEPIIPQTILDVVQEIRKKVDKIGRDSIDQSVLYHSLMNILTDKNISFLRARNETQINRGIVAQILGCCKALAYPYVESIAEKLLVLAASDYVSEDLINSYNNRRKWGSYWIRARRVGAWIIVILFFTTVIASIMEERGRVREREDGEVNFGSTAPPLTMIPDPQPEPAPLSPEEQFQIEKQKELDMGFQEANLTNGEMSQCYNYSPKYGSIDNYLDIHVGGGTDVAVKLMNNFDDTCIRYVFINSGSTFRIKNIPEGKYYLKIAYGREWLSKVENDQCIGKFIRNPNYKIGEDVMNYYVTTDYFGREGWTNYSIELDVVSSDVVNSFNTNNISESDFNQ